MQDSATARKPSRLGKIHIFLQLVRSPFTNRFGLTIFSKLLNAEAEIIIADAVTLEKQRNPHRDADSRKRNGRPEAERQKNQKAFRP